jgi:hypothetical protein
MPVVPPPSRQPSTAASAASPSSPLLPAPAPAAPEPAPPLSLHERHENLVDELRQAGAQMRLDERGHLTNSVEIRDRAGEDLACRAIGLSVEVADAREDAQALRNMRQVGAVQGRTMQEVLRRNYNRETGAQIAPASPPRPHAPRSSPAEGSDSDGNSESRTHSGGRS